MWAEGELHDAGAESREHTTAKDSPLWAKGEEAESDQEGEEWAV